MFEALIIVMCFGILYVEIIEILAKLDEVEDLRTGAMKEVSLDHLTAPSRQTH
jgi:hypothetical protein